jgi:hypothetical protein
MKYEGKLGSADYSAELIGSVVDAKLSLGSSSVELKSDLLLVAQGLVAGKDASNIFYRAVSLASDALGKPLAAAPVAQVAAADAPEVVPTAGYNA